MGLGLAIVRRLADLLAHQLEVSSRPGKGTRFRLHLPRTEAVAVGNGASVTGLCELTDKVALIIDDEPDVRDGMAATFAARGCHVLAASDGQRA